LSYGLGSSVVDANQPNNNSFDTPAEVTGYGWSPNIGWVSFQGANYGVAIRPNGNIDGFAWSPNVGWIRFGGLNPGCPTGSCRAVIDFNTNRLSGWARALNSGDGWDGWISLSADNHGGSTYGVNAQSSGKLGGYAWGSDVIGWFNFADVSVNTPCAPVSSCTADLESVESTDMWCRTTVTDCATGQSCVPATASCVSGINVLEVEPTIVRSGDSVTITWDTVPGMFSSCRVEGRGEGWNGLSNSSGVSSSPLGNNTSRYQLICTDAVSGSESVVEQVDVRVLPTIREI